MCFDFLCIGFKQTDVTVAVQEGISFKALSTYDMYVLLDTMTKAVSVNLKSRIY